VKRVKYCEKQKFFIASKSFKKTSLKFNPFTQNHGKKHKIFLPKYIDLCRQ
jgi:hypothetical protein